MRLPTLMDCAYCGGPLTVEPGEYSRARYCSPACRDAMRPTLDLDAFWSKVQQTECCWLWTAARVPGGYGNLGGDGAHRVAWRIQRGPISAGLYVLHNCPGGDNKRCVRGDHLWVGTAQQNAQDAVDKARRLGLILDRRGAWPLPVCCEQLAS